MTTIFAFFLVLFINAVAFAYSNLHGHPSWMSWLVALASIGYLFRFAIRYKRPRYVWMAAYETDCHKGRVFYECYDDRPSTELVSRIEQYARDDLSVKHCHLVSLKYLGPVKTHNNR